jgi:hypothetical protein
MEIHDVMRASSVRRWHIVATSRSQSLAEHSFNVAQIALAILDEFKCGMREYWGGQVVLMAINHDLYEVYEGDIPSTAKPDKDWSAIFAGILSPEMIVKAADVLETYTFLYEHKVGRHAEQSLWWMQGQYENMVNHMPDQLVKAVREVEHKILFGEFKL